MKGDLVEYLDPFTTSFNLIFINLKTFKYKAEILIGNYMNHS